MKLEDKKKKKKVNVLEGLIARTELETEYSIDVEWLENPEYMKREVKVLIDNCRRLFKNDSIKKLDSDIVADAYATFNTRLDSFLKRFPEYRLNDVITESIGQRHM